MIIFRMYVRHSSHEYVLYIYKQNILSWNDIND